MTPTQAERHGLSLNKDGQRRTAFELLSHPNIDIARLARIWPPLAELAPNIAEQLEIDAKYDVYLSRQAADIAAYRRDESLILPDHFDYGALRGLSNEARQKLQSSRPRTVGQAGRLDGITPATLTLLVAHLKRDNRQPKSAKAAAAEVDSFSGTPVTRPTAPRHGPLPLAKQGEVQREHGRTATSRRT